MNKKLNIILKLIIFIILIAVAALIYYVFSVYNNREYIISDVGRNFLQNEKIDVVSRKKIEFPYSVEFFNKYFDFNGKLDLIDNKLILSEIFDGKTTDKQLLDENIKDIMLFDIDEIDMLFMYVLCENNNLYSITLNSNVLDDIEIEKINVGNLKFKEFVDINYRSFYGNENKYATLVTEDGYTYIVSARNITPYENNILLVDDKYIVYDMRNVVATIDGRLFCNEKGELIRVKYILEMDNESKVFKDNPHIIFITEDNRVVYNINDKLYIYNSVIDKIEHNGTGTKQEIKLILKNGDKIKFNASFNEVYYTLLNIN